VARGRSALLAAFLLLAVARDVAAGRTLRARDADGLRRALARAKPGTTILLAPGTYAGGITAQGLKGTEKAPIVIRSQDPKRPARLEGGASSLQLSSIAWVEIRDLVLTGATGNGLNLDDGGTITEPSHHVTVARVTVTNIGPDGNNDGIKLSGLDDFRIEDCLLEDWGRRGSGIDMVGCHDGVIAGCTLRRTESGERGSGVQAKGGTRAVTIRRCRFERAGSRAVNLGGSTGRRYFRPPNPGYEAKDLVVEDCTFIGSEAPIAFVGVDGAVVRHNTVYRPGRWVMRILQETRGDDFVPCRNGRFERNLVVFDGSLNGAANVGPGAQPETFVFADNYWYCRDAPGRSRPDLPTREKDGTYGKDPRFVDAEKGDLALKPNSPARKYGPRPVK
jgi:hypothetical protein